MPGNGQVEFPFARHPARQGLVWLAQAYRMFSRHRLAWVVMILGYYLALLLLHSLPLIGPYVMALLKPVIAVGLLAAAWNQERGGAPSLRQLLRGFQTNLWALLPIGIFYIAGITLAVYGSALVDGGKLLDFIAKAHAMSEEQMVIALRDGGLQVGMLSAALLAVPVLLATWWAPALVVFQDAKGASALVASFRAALANWRPLAIYAFGVLIYAVVVPSLFTLVVALVLPPPVGSALMVAILFPYALLLTTTIQISDYVSYRDVFHAGEALTPIATTR